MNGGQIKLHEILADECRVLDKTQEAGGITERIRSLETEGRKDEARCLLSETVERLSRGENKVIYDEAGVPSVMVRIPALRCSELLEGRGSGFHPAFCGKNGVIREVWVSKYINCVVDGRAASLPMRFPQRVSTHEEAVSLCRAKGDNWLPMPFQLRMAIALWCRRQGFWPGGNNHGGHDFLHPEECGTSAEDGLTLTGSGPLKWSHNGRREGIWDLNGNLNEWDVGLRLMNGEIQIIEMEDLLAPDGDLSSKSALWHAFGVRGERLPAGDDHALCYAAAGGGIRLGKRAEQAGVGNCAFWDIRAENGLEVPDALRLLGLFPPEGGNAKTTDWRWVNTQGERLPLSGGAYRALDHAGIFFTGMTKHRRENYTLAGVRCICVDPLAVEEGSL